MSDKTEHRNLLSMVAGMVAYTYGVLIHTHVLCMHGASSSARTSLSTFRARKFFHVFLPYRN